MLTQVVLQTSTPMTFNIDNADPDEILILKGISGLTPQPNNLFTGEFARDGGYYQGRRTGARPLTFKFRINPDYANDIEVSDIRELLYRAFYEPQADSDGIQVLLVDDRKPDRFLTCYTETWQGDIFEKDPAVDINAVSTDAMIRSVDITTDSDVNGWLTVPVNYDGSADTGVVLSLKVISATSTVTIQNNNQIMTLAGTFVADDVIDISTVQGERYIRLNGVDKMVLLQSPAQWITLKTSANLFQVYGTAVADGKVRAMSYSFRSAWRGV